MTIEREHGRIVSVVLQNAGDELVGTHAIGVTVLTVDDAYPFSESGGLLRIGGVTGATLSYTGWNETTNTITLSAATTVAYSDGDRVELLPLTPTKTAQVVLDGFGGSVPARVLHVLDPYLREGIRDPNDQEYALLLSDGDGYLVLDVLGKVAAIEAAAVSYPTITNLCTDPRPTTAANWYGGDNGLVQDTTYTSQGLYIRKNPAYFSSLGQFAPPGNSFTVNPAQSYFGTVVKTFRVISDLQWSFRCRTDADVMSIVSEGRAYNAAGTFLGTFNLNGTQVVPAYTSRTLVWSLDFAALSASYPTLDSVTMRFEYSLPVIGALQWFGSCMVVDTTNLPVGFVPYSDGTTKGWVTNADGTTTGPVNHNDPVSWFDLQNTPDVFYVAPKPVTVASQAAMLALSTALVGQVVVRSDNLRTYELAALPASTLANWLFVGLTGVAGTDVVSGIIATARLGTGTQDVTTVLRGDGTWGAAAGSGVTSVAGKTGAVTLDAADVVSGTFVQARLGSGSAGAGAKFLADDQTYKTATGAVSSVAGKTGAVVLDAADIATGTFVQARLGTGSGGAGTKVLYDDQTYKAPAAAGLSTGVQVNQYTTAQTGTSWTKPTGAVTVHFSGKAGGGGGGAGYKGGSAVARSGGGGGGSGGYFDIEVPASVLPATLYVTVGAGGAGGASSTTSDTVGLGGTGGSTSSDEAFLTYVSTSSSATIATSKASAIAYATGGGPGSGGSSQGGGASGVAGLNGGGVGGAHNDFGQAASGLKGGGGGGGSMQSGSNLLQPGGSTLSETDPTFGKFFGVINPAGTTTAGAAGIAASTIAAMTYGPQQGLGGTGGNGSNVGNAGVGGAGIYGGGGGGGGPSTNAVGNSGAGGAGGAGYLVITTHF